MVTRIPARIDMNTKRWTSPVVLLLLCCLLCALTAEGLVASGSGGGSGSSSGSSGGDSGRGGNVVAPTTAEEVAKLVHFKEARPHRNVTEPGPAGHDTGFEGYLKIYNGTQSQSFAQCCNNKFLHSFVERMNMTFEGGVESAPLFCRFAEPKTHWTVPSTGFFGTHEFDIQTRCGNERAMQNAFVTAKSLKNTTWFRYYVLNDYERHNYVSERVQHFHYYEELSMPNFTQCAFTGGAFEEEKLWGLRLVVQWYDSTGAGADYALSYGGGASQASLFVALAVVFIVTTAFV